ncbi:MAG: septum formation initiator family protein [Elusimicrobia bacterium]|nr:septum formation initiator family protein [Elusimicrobiota bacterium]
MLRWIKWGLVLVVLALFFGNKGFRSLVRNYMELKKVQKEWSSLKQEEADLQEKIQLASHQDSYIEKLARRELGLIKKGELEYRFKP